MVCETEKPKRSGCEEKSLLIMGDLPVPEGPEKTIGRAVEGSMGAIFLDVVVVYGVDSAGV